MDIYRLKNEVTGFKKGVLVTIVDVDKDSKFLTCMTVKKHENGTYYKHDYLYPQPCDLEKVEKE